MIATGSWQGEIVHTARGRAGFGYDPLMFVPALGCTVAEMSTTQKNSQSHRALAGAQMLSLLRSHWQLQVLA